MAENETAESVRQKSASSERQARQAAALRDNLRKRKAQQRQRLARAGPDHAAEKPQEPGDAATDTPPKSAAKARDSA